MKEACRRHYRMKCQKRLNLLVLSFEKTTLLVARFVLPLYGFSPIAKFAHPASWRCSPCTYPIGLSLEAAEWSL